MKFFAKILDTVTPFIFGLCAGIGFVAFAVMQHPVMSTIIQNEGGDKSVRFTVVCAARTNSQVTCIKEKELTDAN